MDKRTQVVQAIEASTICAPATGMGGGVAMVRISGTNALEALQDIFTPAKRSEWNKKAITPRRVYFGKLTTPQGDFLDEVLVTYFPGPHSYTGEDVIEIACHASEYVVRTLLEILITTQGCTMAAPGEFTKRAFLNRRLDLTEAEAVADLIASETKSQHAIAARQLKGALSKELNSFRTQLLHFAALLELELDFSEEDVEFANRQDLIHLAQQAQTHLSKLIESFAAGNAIKNGISVAIVGATNVGKSTLLNALLGAERAIVSNIHGTTRDTIEETFTLQGVLFRLVDTAGMRQTADPIEKLGIERSKQKIEEAQIILQLVDISQPIQPMALYGEPQKTILIFNKTDLLPETLPLQQTIQKTAQDTKALHVMAISARQKQGISELQTTLLEQAQILTSHTATMVLTNTRHLTALQKAQEALHRIIEGLHQQIPTDLLSADLRIVINELGEITGETISNQAILSHIFSHFCIGK